MPPRTKMRISSRISTLQTRAGPSYGLCSRQIPFHVQRRAFADDKRPIEDRPFENRPSEKGEQKGPNMDQLPHVSEEAAATSKSMGGQGPDIESHGSTVAEVVEGDKKAQENLPKVMQEQLKKEKASGSDGKRSFSTFTRAQHRTTSSSLSANITYRHTQGRSFYSSFRLWEQLQEHVEHSEAANMQALQQLSSIHSGEIEPESEESQTRGGLKFDPPAYPPVPGSHLRKRYDTVVDQVTKLIMVDGKLSAAQKHMNNILTHLRTSPAPRPSDRAPLIPNAPPHAALPLNPVLYLTVAIDSVAPLFRIRSQKGLAGGGVALQIPIPLRERQRRRTAIMWILDQTAKRKGGTSPFPKRFAEEIIAIVEGRSTVWERRSALHGIGIRARANLAVRRK